MFRNLTAIFILLLLSYNLFAADYIDGVPSGGISSQQVSQIITESVPSIVSNIAPTIITNSVSNILIEVSTNFLPKATNSPSFGMSPIASDTSGTNWHWGVTTTDTSLLENRLDNHDSTIAALAFQTLTDRTTSKMQLRSSYMSWMALGDDWDVGLSSNSVQPYNGVRYVGAATPGLAANFIANGGVSITPITPLVTANGWTVTYWLNYRSGISCIWRDQTDNSPVQYFRPNFQLESTQFGSYVISVNDWTHIAIVHRINSTTNIVYKNGAVWGIAAMGGDSYNLHTITKLQLGTDGGNHCNGILDDFRFYTNELSQATIQSIYNSGMGQAVISDIQGMVLAVEFESNYVEYISGVVGTNTEGRTSTFTNSIITYAGTNYGRMVSSNFSYEITPNKVYAAGYITSKNTNTILNVTAWGELSCDDGTNWYKPVWTNRSLGDTREMWETVWTNTTQTGTQIRVKWIATNSASYVMEGSQRSAY